MSSKAFIKYNKTARRCEVLIDTYDKLKVLGESNEITVTKDIIRGAVVLAASALDAYVTDVFAEKFVSYLKNYKIDDSLVELLYKAGFDTREGLEMIKMERPYRRVRKLIDQYYNKYTTQKFAVIDELFKIYHLPKITDSAQARSGRKTLKVSVTKLIERRHEIAHNGDYNSHDRINDIDSAFILKKIKDLDLLVSNMDYIINNKIQ